MVTIRDMTVVKQLERMLRRRLTEEEMSGETFEARLPGGVWVNFRVPLLVFPDDLLPAYALISQPEPTSDDETFYEELEAI